MKRLTITFAPHLSFTLVIPTFSALEGAMLILILFRAGLF